MKTYYILCNTDQLRTQLTPMQVFEKIEDLKQTLLILTSTGLYWTIYKVEREKEVSIGQNIELNPSEDQAAIIHIFQMGWEIFFQPIDQFPPKRRASQINAQPPKLDDNNANAIYALLGINKKTATIEHQMYTSALQYFLSNDFFRKDKQGKWQEIFSLRLKDSFYTLLYNHPELSRALLRNAAHTAGENAQIALSTSTLLDPLFKESASSATALSGGHQSSSNNNNNNELKKIESPSTQIPQIKK